MQKYEIRHLPVQVSGQLVGILSERDVNLALAYDYEGQTLIQHLMLPDPYSVLPTTALTEVAEVMAQKKYGCAIVQNLLEKVIGIFTAVDGMRMLSAKKKRPNPRVRKKK